MTDQIAKLDHWVAHGGTCQLIELAPDRGEIALCRCDGGEEVERFTSTDPAVLAWVRENGSPID